MFCLKSTQTNLGIRKFRVGACTDTALDRVRDALYHARLDPAGWPLRARYVMARVCEVCGKTTVFGNSVSHAHNVTNRRWLPNLQRVRVRVEGGATKRVRICTRCLRSGKVEKAVS